MKVITTPWPALPTEVPGTCYRFACKHLRNSFLDKTVTLDIDGEEYTLPERGVRVGLVEGKLRVDVNENVAKNFGLV